MVEYNITPHKFDAAKNKIKVFSEQTQTNAELSRVETSGGLFGAFKHKVTGEEMNDLTSQIQYYLVEINSTNQKIIGQLGEVYNTFEALDNDYMKGIVMSVKSVEKTSDDLKVAQNKLDKQQNDLDRTVKVQQKTTKILYEKFGKTAHFDDIDSMWSDIKKNKEMIIRINELLEAQKQVFDDIYKRINQNKSNKNYEKLQDEFEELNENFLMQEYEKNDNVLEKKNFQNLIFNFSSKLKKAYIVAGASLCLSLIELVVLLVR